MRGLSELILNLAENDPGIRRECFDYLKENSSVSKMSERRSEGEAVMSIWADLLPDLEDLDAYGGGPYGVEDQVWELLYEITKRLTSKKVDGAYRREILDAILLLNCSTLPKTWRRCMMTGKPVMPVTFIGRSGTMINILSFG